MVREAGWMPAHGSGGSCPTASLPARTVVRVGCWSTSGPQILNLGLSAWKLACQVSVTSAPQVSDRLRLSVSSRRVPVLPPPSGTQRARWGMTIWMQTIGATLVAVERCSLVRMCMPAHGSRSAYVAVPRCCTGRLARVPTLPGARPQHAFKSARLGSAQVMESVAWTACPPNPASGSGRPACQPGRWRCMSYLEKRDCPCCNE